MPRSADEYAIYDAILAAAQAQTTALEREDFEAFAVLLDRRESLVAQLRAADAQSRAANLRAGGEPPREARGRIEAILAADAANLHRLGARRTAVLAQLTQIREGRTALRRYGAISGAPPALFCDRDL